MYKRRKFKLEQIAQKRREIKINVDKNNNTLNRRIKQTVEKNIYMSGFCRVLIKRRCSQGLGSLGLSPPSLNIHRNHPV
jgi:hypothetical protein